MEEDTNGVRRLGEGYGERQRLSPLEEPCLQGDDCFKEELVPPSNCEVQLVAPSTESYGSTSAPFPNSPLRRGRSGTARCTAVYRDVRRGTMDGGVPGVCTPGTMVVGWYSTQGTPGTLGTRVSSFQLSVAPNGKSGKARKTALFRCFPHFPGF